jgi:hypothetical protein
MKQLHGCGIKNEEECKEQSLLSIYIMESLILAQDERWRYA